MGVSNPTPNPKLPEIATLLRRLAESSEPGTAVDRLPPPHLRHLPEREREQDIKLKRIYAACLLAGLGLELVAMNVGFFLYAALGKHWRIPDAVIGAWFGAGVVQVVGVVTIVVHHLFPKRGSGK
jgi:hypothetical protein